MHALLAQENLDFGHLKNGKLIAYRSAELLDKRARWSPTRPRMAPTSRCWTPPRPWRWSRPWPAWAPAWRARSIRPAKRRAIAASSPRHCSTACRAWPTCNARCPIRSRACSGRPPRRGGAEPRRRHRRDAVVLATGIGTRALLSPLGHDVPLYPLKGYSLTVPLADDDHMAPAISVTDYERRIVYARVAACCASRRWWTSAAATRRSTRNASRCSSARSTRHSRPGPAPGHSLPDCDRPRPGQAADRPQPRRRQSVAEHRPGRAGLHAGLRQRGVAERADGRTGTAAGSGAVPALSPGRLDGAARTGMSFCDSDCLSSADGRPRINRMAVPLRRLAWRSGNRFPFSG